MQIAIPILFVFLLISSTSSSAQTNQKDSSDIFSYDRNVFLSLFLPKGIAEGVALRSYLRSLSWDEYRHSVSEKEAFDEIFLDADELCKDNRAAALLASSIAVLEHKTIPVKLLFGIILQIPLTMESDRDFDARVRELPVHIYDPKIPDVDKLQHFFFSAYFEKSLKMNWLVRLLGNGVEIGEDLFIIGGVDDPRDKHANEDGIGFGVGCEADSLQMPSNFLTPNP
jgi:hypothetical protein